jgi:HlyD family secretion protein
VRALPPWLRTRTAAALLLLLAAFALVGARLLGRVGVQPALTAVVGEGTLVLRLTETGTLRPAQSITYRSPLGGREAEIVFLVPEGTVVSEGDLLVRVETAELRRELERAVQDARQADVEYQLAEVEREEGKANVESLTEGEGALGVEETRSRLRLAEKKVQRLRQEYEALQPLMERGFITGDELQKSAFDLEVAETDLDLARRKAAVYIERRHPRDQRQAELQLAQRRVKGENARLRLSEARARVQALREAVENCSIYARAPGLVVYEEFLGGGQRRKIRAGDRVTGTQGLVTIPEVARMLVEASVPEAAVHRVRPGQPAVIRVEAFPDLQLTGRVTRVGALARSSAERPYEDKRFDLVVEVVDARGADLRPEMTARVDVMLGERRGVLLAPVNAIFERQGAPVCHVVRAFGVDTRPVELGESDGFFVEVRAGLRPGDRVALTDVAGTPARAGAPAAGGQAAGTLGRPALPAERPLAPR